MTPDDTKPEKAEASAAPWVERYGQPKNDLQFSVRIALHAMKIFGMRAKEAIPFAGQAYQDFARQSRTTFGDSAFAWDDAAARTIALEYGSDH